MRTEPITPTEPVRATEMLQAEADVVDAVSIPGGIRMADYELTERLGAGGYGEVWKAIGPGGLPKAVKILYGQQDGSRAEAELKSLERMRDLRHPFLLSIERIEVIDSRLIVVTELADKNLAERFQEVVADKQHGIQRDELLSYLRDAADALDFMAEKHGLQHLDIKPDNILLQGDHAKVADFGLAKDLNATNVSVLNGFTPTYAAPELFEGRPGRASDQYSLAIVYQSMLTGQVPFNGRTAAQLTAQHLKSRPDLSSLQPVDRPVVARALSKNQHSRFDSCRQFVDELSRRKHQRSRSKVNVLQPPDADQNTAVLETQLHDTRDLAREQSTPVAISPEATDNRSPRPVVYLSVGGLGASVLARLKNKFASVTDDNSVPALLAIDTDRSQLAEVQRGSTLTPEETLSIPLRSSRDYRNARNIDLSWLSRRWLFNIPRSCQVEGIRPLGRLALVDHRAAIEARLKDLIQQALASHQSADGLDIYIVGSASGGTSSGALIDLGYMAAQVAGPLTSQEVQTHAVLIHCTGAMRNVTDVQEANSTCLLQELHHLSTPGLATPRGLDNKPSDDPPFDHTYLVHLGDGLSNDGFESESTNVAGFLLAAAGDAQFDLRAWREQSEVSSDFCVRMLGLSDRDATSFRTASDEGGNLAAALIRRWAEASGGGRDSNELQVSLTDTASLLDDLKLTTDTLPAQIRSLLVGTMGSEIQACATVLHQQAVAAEGNQLTNLTLIDFLRSNLSTAGSADDDSPTLTGIVLNLRKSLQEVSGNCEVMLRRHFFALPDSPLRLNGALAAVDFTSASLQQTADVCGQLLSEIETAFAEFMTRLDAESQLNNEDGLQLSREYCGLIGWQTVYQCFLQHVSTVTNSVERFRTQLDALRTGLSSDAATLQKEEAAEGAIPQAVVDAFDRHIRTVYPSLLAETLRRGTDRTLLRNQCLQAATQFLMAASQKSESGSNHTHDFPRNCWPRFRGSGGRRRVLGIVPEAFNQAELLDRLKQEFDDCVATRAEKTDSVCVICEIEGVTADKLIQRITHSNPHIADVAARIHTRTDVDWR